MLKYEFYNFNQTSLQNLVKVCCSLYQFSLTQLDKMSAINFLVCHIFTLKTESCFKLSVLHCSMIPIRVIATKIPTSLHKIANSGLRIKILHTISHNEPSVSFLSFFLVSFFRKKKEASISIGQRKMLTRKLQEPEILCLYYICMFILFGYLLFIYLWKYLYPESLNLMCGDCTMHRTYCQIKSVIHYR